MVELLLPLTNWKVPNPIASSFSYVSAMSSISLIKIFSVAIIGALELAVQL